MLECNFMNTSVCEFDVELDILSLVSYRVFLLLPWYCVRTEHVSCPDRPVYL